MYPVGQVVIATWQGLAVGLFSSCLKVETAFLKVGIGLNNVTRTLFSIFRNPQRQKNPRPIDSRTGNETIQMLYWLKVNHLWHI